MLHVIGPGLLASVAFVVVVAACSGEGAVLSESDRASLDHSPPGGSPPAAVMPTQPVRTTTRAIGPTSFTSTTYGYSLIVPAGWTMSEAIANWDGIGMPGDDAPVADVFESPTGQMVWAVGALTKGTLPGYVDDRIEANFADRGDDCPAAPAVQKPIEIGGQDGSLVNWDCGFLFNLAITVRGGMAYQFAFQDEAVDAASDRTDDEMFAGLLRSLRFP
jgi:hypothetical protein